jgi:D-alanine-D-alanine ligase
MTLKTKDVMPRLGTIGVLMGGVSSERDVSLRSGLAVVDALKKTGCTIVPIEIKSHEREQIISDLRLAEIQLAFVALHGKFGEDGTIQSILEDLEIPYTGSGIRASACAFNKVTTQRTLRACGLPVADFFVADAVDLDVDAIVDALKEFPLVVKPSCEGSSFGVTVVHSKADFPSALNEAFRYGNEIIVEKFIAGRELTVGILDHEVLPIVEICPSKQFFDFEAKYQKGLTDYIIPAQLSDGLTQRVGEIALKAHQAVGCEGYSRVDFRLDHANQPFILEINTIPGFTETSLFPKAARQAGIDFSDVCLKLIQLAYGKKK